MTIKNEFDASKIKTITFEPIIYTKYCIPKGFLANTRACQALFFYATRAKHVYDTHVKNPVVLEGDEDPPYDLRQLFKSVALMYGVEPEEMVKYWSNVDMQFHAMGQQKVPEGDWIRFDSVPEIKTVTETKQ